MIFLMVMFPFIYRAWSYEQPSLEPVVPPAPVVPSVKALPEIGVEFQTVIRTLMSQAGSLDRVEPPAPESGFPKETQAYPRSSLWVRPLFGLEGSESRPEKILVGSDGSEASKAALKDADFLAGHYGCPTLSLTVTEDPAAPALIAAAYKNRCDMIAVGTSTRTLKERVRLGSTAELLIRLSPLPVWVSRTGPRGSLSGQLRRILVVIDETPHSLRTVAQALLLAHDFGASFTILHVHEKNQNRQSAFDLHRPLLEAIPWKAKSIEEESPDPTAAVAVAAYAHQDDCDLIVMGAHREELRSNALTPSHASDVLRSASEEESRPMLVLHPYN